jgi:site-specific DNA-methyltransferase (adenine-specific)
MDLIDIKKIIPNKPYYESDNGVLYCCDNIEILPLLPNKSIDLVLCDPPYGIGAYANGTMGGGVLGKQSSYDVTFDDTSIPHKEIFNLITKYPSIIFGGNYFIEYLTNSSCWLVWDKVNGENYFADCELAWTNFKTAVRKYTWKWQGMLQQDMKTKDERIHPTQKPLGLFKLILQDYSKDNDLILDPFSGSGTTAVACEDLNRRWICIEKEEKYCELSAKRIENFLAQGKLF